MSCHCVSEGNDLVGFEPISESATFDQVILTVDNLSSIIVEYDDSIQDIACDVLSADTHMFLDLSVQVHFFDYVNSHIWTINFLNN